MIPSPPSPPAHGALTWLEVGVGLGVGVGVGVGVGLGLGSGLGLGVSPGVRGLHVARRAFGSSLPRGSGDQLPLECPCKGV